METKIANANVVIYVDDCEADRELTEICYKRSRLTNPLVTMKSGLELLRHLDRIQSSHASMPAMILIDISMPVIDGFELIQAIRRYPAFAELPIVVLSTSDEIEDREMATRFGAQAYAVKPLDPQGYVTFFDAMGRSTG